MSLHSKPSFLNRKTFFLLFLVLGYNTTASPKSNTNQGSRPKSAQPSENKHEVRNLIKCVDQNIFTGIGKCSFGVPLPFGSVRPCPRSPNSRNGYIALGKISGFTCINSGMVNKYVHLLISPQKGLSCWDNGNNRTTEYDSDISNEVSRPDYYSVDLTRYGIKTEITSARNITMYRFTYPEANNGEAIMMIYFSDTHGGKSTYSSVNYDAKNKVIYRPPNGNRVVLCQRNYIFCHKIEQTCSKFRNVR